MIGPAPSFSAGLSGRIRQSGAAAANCGSTTNECAVPLAFGLPIRQISVLLVLGEPWAAPQCQLRRVAGPIEIMVEANVVGLGVKRDARPAVLGEQLSAEKNIVPPQPELIPGIEAQILRLMVISWT